MNSIELTALQRSPKKLRECVESVRPFPAFCAFCVFDCGAYLSASVCVCRIADG